jgi:hypothetical protein
LYCTTQHASDFRKERKIQKKHLVPKPEEQSFDLTKEAEHVRSDCQSQLPVTNEAEQDHALAVSVAVPGHLRLAVIGGAAYSAAHASCELMIGHQSFESNPSRCCPS